MLTEIGKLSDSGDGCFKWTIENFLRNVWRAEYRLISPDFFFSGSKFNLYTYRSKEDDALRLYMRERNEPFIRMLNVSLSIKTGYQGKLETRRGETNEFGYFRTGVWMSCSELLARRSEILTEGQLTVFCSLNRLDVEEYPPSLQAQPPSQEKVPKENKDSENYSQENSAEDSDEEATVPCPKIVKKLQKDLKDLLTSGEDCDVTIKVQGKEFPAHRGILRARSPVFKTMFGHEMVEKLSGKVVIEDCDPETFADFLNYLYTGSIKHISDDNVLQLYIVSDKYQVEELKEKCKMFMSSHMSVGTFCDILTLALRHSEKEMIDLSMEFFCANATEIAVTCKWKKFVGENPIAANELFLKVLSSGKKV